VKNHDYTKNDIKEMLEILQRNESVDVALVEVLEVLRFRISRSALRHALQRRKLGNPSEYLIGGKRNRLKDKKAAVTRPSPYKNVNVDKGEEAPEHRALLSLTAEQNEKVLQLVKLTKKSPMVFEDMLNSLDISPARGKQVIEDAKNAGIELNVAHGHITLDSPEPEDTTLDVGIPPVVGEPQRVAVISDTHFGSKYCLRKQLREFIRYVYSQGVTEILHVGDFLDGIYKHGLNELSHYGLDDQCNDAYRTLPELPGLKYYAIAGNHDATYWDRTGQNPGYAIESWFRHPPREYEMKGRNDVSFIGHRGRFMTIRGVRVHLWHPKSGKAYAKCYDEDTDILTENGWKPFRDLLPGEKVATLTEDHRVEYHVPDAYQTYDFSGDLYQLNGRHVDLAVTPGHDLYVSPAQGSRRWQRKNIEECAQDWGDSANGKWRALKNALPRKGDAPTTFSVPMVDSTHSEPVEHLGEVPIVPFLRLLGYYVSEGCVSRRKSAKGAPWSMIDFSRYQGVNPDVYEDIYSCVKAVGLSAYRGKYGLRVNSRELAEYLVASCGVGSSNKRIPRWVLELDHSMQAEFFDAYAAGDGSWPHGAAVSAQTKSRGLADDLQEMALHLGMSASVCFMRDRSMWGVSFNRYKNEPCMDLDLERVPYDGKVYDVTVKNHVLYVRRNGKACWSGNSYHLQKLVHLYASGEKPNISLAGHWHMFNYCVERGVHLLACPTFQGGGSAYGKSLGGAPEIGGLILEWAVTEHGTIRSFKVERRSYFESEKHFRTEVNHGDVVYEGFPD